MKSRVVFLGLAKQKGNPMVEEAVYLEDILKILGWSRRKFFRNKDDLVSVGAVFYRNEGRPPTKKICSYPSRLIDYVTSKAKKNEVC